MNGPPQRLGQAKRVKLLQLIEQHARLEVGLRTGYFARMKVMPKGGLSHANDMVDVLDEIRKLVLGTSDLGPLADKFGFGWPERKKT